MPDSEHPTAIIVIDGAAYDEPAKFSVILTPTVLRRLADLGDLMIETGDGHYDIQIPQYTLKGDDTDAFLEHVEASLS